MNTCKISFLETRARVGPGPDLLDRAKAGPGPGPAEGGPDLKGQGQGQQISARSGPDQPVDSLSAYTMLALKREVIVRI
jgi:hypothetical protein